LVNSIFRSERGVRGGRKSEPSERATIDVFAHYQNLKRSTEHLGMQQSLKRAPGFVTSLRVWKWWLQKMGPRRNQTGKEVMLVGETCDIQSSRLGTAHNA
jgi:hypothetical protein